MVKTYMDIPWGPFFTFICVASFTPGPNNLNAAAMGMDGGYRRALPFIIGVYFGVSILLSLVGFLKLAVSDFFYNNITIFKIAGSAYLLWLAFSMIRKKDGLPKVSANTSFFKGVTLQLVNPKGLFFSMTLYALFLTAEYSWYQIVAMSFIWPVITFIAVSTWAFAGAFLSKYLENPSHRRIFFWIMAMLLVYTVVTILTKEFV